MEQYNNYGYDKSEGNNKLSDADRKRSQDYKDYQNSEYLKEIYNKLDSKTKKEVDDYINLKFRENLLLKIGNWMNDMMEIKMANSKNTKMVSKYELMMQNKYILDPKYKYAIDIPEKYKTKMSKMYLHERLDFYNLIPKLAHEDNVEKIKAFDKKHGWVKDEIDDRVRVEKNIRFASKEEELRKYGLKNENELKDYTEDKDLKKIFDLLSEYDQTELDKKPLKVRSIILHRLKFNYDITGEIDNNIIDNAVFNNYMWKFDEKPKSKLEKISSEKLTPPEGTTPKMTPPEGTTPKMTPPSELFEEEYEEEAPKQKTNSAEELDKLVELFYSQTLDRKARFRQKELEVRFGTKGIKPLTKNDYDNVIKTIKSFGFSTNNPMGLYSLRTKCEFLDSRTGKFKMSDIRTEINGISTIEKYCKSNDISSIYKSNPNNILFNHKKPFYKDEKVIVRPVNFDDFNFRVSFQTEERANSNIENFILDNWTKSKKEFRYLNRVSFTHPDFPFIIDLSITKSGNKEKDARGFTRITPVYTLQESNVLNNSENYEIEIEVDTAKIGPGTEFNSSEKIVAALRKVIKYVLSGLQGTNYPVSYAEQDEIIKDYMKMIWEDNYDPSKRITSQYFIGPNSITLQLTNISPLDSNSDVANIRKDFVVTDKADGDRHLMYVSNKGRIYFISSNMDVKFTGAKTKNEECFNTLVDGELISHDKKGTFINLYAAFDIYFIKNKDIRNYPLMPIVGDEPNKSRYQMLDKLRKLLKPVSVVSNVTENMNFTNLSISPIRFEVKKFCPMSSKESIFDGCRTILNRDSEHLFEYETDGLIFTHAYYGVGNNQIGKAGPKTKITWEYSFKWKPPQFNTIDFLVTTIKETNGEDSINTMFSDGLTLNSYNQLYEYKTVELRCGFNQKTDGYINPCQDILDDNVPEYKTRFEDKQSNDYMPQRFYPTEPYNPNAGLCKIMLNKDDTGLSQMFTKNNEVIKDNTIVEFAYDIDAPEGWNWVPLRVRYDKTAKLLRGEREYGNSYKVCNENWKSIHPSGRITEEMLMTGQNIPEIYVSEDVYYNTPSGDIKTECLKNFHNLYVKKTLITGACQEGDTLIDFACGKAGDLPKWISAKLSFVFGVDYSSDNLENRLDGACARYLNSKKTNKHVPYALFVHGNSSYNIKDGTALLNDKAKQTANAVFGNGPKDADKIGKGVVKQYGKGANGFNVSSCQFAIHYFFENPDTLKGFLRNVAECTQLNGYFIGTSYDGKLIFNELKKTEFGKGIQINQDGKKIWEIIKDYTSDLFEDDSSSIGYRINVYQESINQYISEYLVNYAYLDRLMEMYGFVPVTKEEATDMRLPGGSGLFGELFINMMEEIKRNPFKSTMYKDAAKMTANEKKISFLNRYFVYKKVREVNIDNLQIELGEYNDSISQREKQESEKAVEIAKDEIVKEAKKTKVKKLDRKIELVPATEALEEAKVLEEKEEVKVIEETEKKITKTKEKAQKLDEDCKPGSCPPGQKCSRKTKRCETNKTKKIKFIIEEDDEE